MSVPLHDLWRRVDIVTIGINLKNGIVKLDNAQTVGLEELPDDPEPSRYFDETSVSLLRDEQKVITHCDNLVCFGGGWERVFDHAFDCAGEEIAVPAGKGSTPVGLVSGPDGNAWVVLLGNSTTGTGTFGRINADASIDWFTLSSNVGKTAGIIHVAFAQDPSQFWLLGSSTLCASCINAVFTVKIADNSTTGTAAPRITVQNSIVLPTQYSWTHRIIYHNGGLYVTELTTSTLANISGVAADGLNVSETWDQYADWGLGLKAQGIDYNNTIF